MEGMKNGENWMIDLEEMIWMNDYENWISHMTYFMIFSCFERIMEMNE